MSPSPSGTDTRLADTFGGFFDDAAIFPPGLVPLETAVREHLERRGTSLAAVTGPLILTLDELGRAAELAAAFFTEAGTGETDAHGPLRISLVAPAARLGEVLAAADALGPAAAVEVLELKTSPARTQWREEIAAAASIRGRTVFVELDAAQLQAGALSLLAGTPVRFKYRTGGIRPELFPTARQLAGALFEAVALGIPFKLTAGLHEAVRYTNPATGFTHHGFVNISLATARAQAGGTVAELEQILLDTDTARLATEFAALSAGWREAFTAFGTCSIGEPIDSLARLGLVADNAAHPAPIKEPAQP